MSQKMAVHKLTLCVCVLCQMQPLKLVKKLGDADLNADESVRQHDSGV